MRITIQLIPTMPLTRLLANLLKRQPLTRLLTRRCRRRLLGRSGQGVDDFTGLGVVEFFAGLVLDGVGVRLQALNLVAQLQVFLLEILDLLLYWRSSARFCCQAERPSLPLTTCQVMSSARPMAMAVPAGRHARCAQASMRLRSGTRAGRGARFSA